jgi:hypothetical protein
MNASGLLKSALKLEESEIPDLRDKLIAAAEERILEHEKVLEVCRDKEQLLRALAGIEVCKIVVEGLCGERPDTDLRSSL